MFNFIIYFQSTTSQKEILLGNPRDFMIFKFNNRSTFFVNVLFFSENDLFLLKIIFLTLNLAAS